MNILKAIFLLSSFIISLNLCAQQRKSTSGIIDVTNLDSTRKSIYYTRIYSDTVLLSEDKFITIYYPNGNIMETYAVNTFDQEIGMHISFYKNKQIKESYCSHYGQIFGTYLSFYENGQSKIIGDYSDTPYIKIDSAFIYDKQRNAIGAKQFSMYEPKKIGTWYYFDSKGKLIREEKYSIYGNLIE